MKVYSVRLLPRRLSSGTKLIKENGSPQNQNALYHGADKRTLSDSHSRCRWSASDSGYSERVLRSRKHPESLVLGSRKFEGRVPLRSRFGNALARTVYRLCSGVSVNDAQTGLRAFTNHLTEKMLSVEGSRYEYETNVLMYSAKT